MQMLSRTQPLLISRSLSPSLKGTPTRKWAASGGGKESAPESAREYLQTRQEATCSHDRFTVTLI